MYTLHGSFNEIAAFITGYTTGRETPIGNKVFYRFVCLKYAFPTNYVWTYVIKSSAKNDLEAISLMEQTILEFVELRKTMTDDELINFALENSNYEEGEVEETFRKFDQALLFGDKELIQSLIIQHKEAYILWSGSYPTDVAKILGEMTIDQPIKKINNTENSNTVEIIAPGWPFPIEMHLIDNKWKVNVERIIEFRKKEKPNSPTK
jgi:hypothetical protein